MGGCNALLPVYSRLKRSRSYKVSALFGPVCKPYIKANGASFSKTGEDLRRAVEKLMSSSKPDVVVVGTSIGMSLDKHAVAWARKHGVPTLGIAESWGDTVIGFSSPGTRDLAFEPDRMCVVDDFLKKRMAKEGFEPSRLAVTGNPYFDALAKKKINRRGQKAVYFFCQPFTEMPGLKTGLDEVRVFGDLVQVMEKLNLDLPVVVRFHPRTKNRHKFDGIIAHSPLRITIDRSKKMKTALERAELVTGMFGATLFEAALMGKKVLSYLPTLTIPDPLMSNRLRLSVPVYRKRDLVPKMKALLEDKNHEKTSAATRNRYVHGRATANVISNIRSLI